MYLLILLNSAINFFYGKIFILFPKESCFLFNMNLEQIASTMFLCKLGTFCGNLFAFSPKKKIKILIFLLIELITYNVLSFFNFLGEIEPFLLSCLRFFFGLTLGFLPALCTQYISKEKITKTHNKYISMIFNSNIIVLPILYIFVFFINIKYWLMMVSLFLIIGIFYLVKSIKTLEQKDEVLSNYISLEIFKKTGKNYFFYCSIVVLIMFIAICGLMANPYLLEIESKDIIYKNLINKFSKDQVTFFYKQIPLIVGSVLFLFSEKINPKILVISTFFSLILNFFISSITLLGINNGLLYSFYVVLVPKISGVLKKKNKEYEYSSFLLYIYKTFSMILIHRFFLKVSLFFIIKSILNYNLFFLPFALFLSLFFLIFSEKF